MSAAGKESPRRRGRAARVAARAASPGAAAAGIYRRVLAPYDPAPVEHLERIEAHALDLLEEIGIEFRYEPALATWHEAGADVAGERVRIPRELLREKVAAAPDRFVQHARNPARSVAIGGDDLMFSPVYGPPFVLDPDGTRRYAKYDDLVDFIRLAYLSPALNHSGGPICEPVDIEIPLRHLHMTYAHLRWSDKPMMGAVTAGSRAKDCLEMCRIVFGADFVASNPVLTGIVNCNSPLVWDETMLEALRVYSLAGQPMIISPFLMQGASTPATMAAVLAQNFAEGLAAVAYVQLLRPGTPVVLGCSGSTVSMQSGAPMNATAESQILSYYGAALGRRWGVPTRLGGMRTSSPTPDAQAAYESAMAMQSAMLAGGHVMLHSAGWLEGGLSTSRAKFVMDCEQVIVLQRLCAGITVDDETLAMDAFREVGPGGQFFGCAHTRRHFENIFYQPGTSHFGTFEQWSEEGARDMAARAGETARRLLAGYEPPPIDPGVDEALREFVARRTREIGAA